MCVYELCVSKLYVCELCVRELRGSMGGRETDAARVDN